MTKFLKVELIGGLCNKLFCFFSAVEIAITEKYVLIEPEFGWKCKVPMHEVWNVDKILLGLPELQWCSLDKYKNLLEPLTLNSNNNIIYKSGSELWEYSETILRNYREKCILNRNTDICCRILLVLEPCISIMDYYNDIITQLNNDNWTAVHFRTESDWKTYSVKKQRYMPPNEHCWTDNKDICDMVISEFGNDVAVYIVSGEHGDDIRTILRDTCVKCEYIYKNELEYEQNAAAHWYLCCLAGGGFVGLSRSTFSNLICFRRELDRVDSRCWIYNYWSDGDKKLQRRVDAGLQPEAYKSITLVTNIM